MPLKQRTSSVDARRDYNAQTWYSVLGLLKIREYLITVDHFSIWRRHLCWAVEDGKHLRDYMTQRYASSMVFMSLLLSTELNILFNSSQVTTRMRYSLHNEEYWLITFWIGIVIIISAILTLLSLISTYTAWCMVSSVHENNAHCIFRSSLGQYVAELPGRLIVGSIYSFLLWVMMFLFVLLPVGYFSIALVALSVLLFAHTICSFSAFGRIIMHSGALAEERVFEQSFERNLLPHSLHAHLLAKARANVAKNTSILRQYRSNSRPIDHSSTFLDQLDDDFIIQASEEGNRRNYDDHNDTPSSRGSYGNQDLLNSQHSFHNDATFDNYGSTSAEHPRRRTDSTVRFADEVDMVKSSTPKETPTSRYNKSDNTHDASITSILEGDAPLSQQTSSSADASDSSVDEPRSTLAVTASRLSTQKGEQNDENHIMDLKPQRPGIVKRDRSNTTAHEGNLEAIFAIRKPKASARPNRTPPAYVDTRSVARAESDSALNISENNSNRHSDWSHKRSSLTEARRSAPAPETRSMGTLPLPWPPNNNTPGLSVLENAARLQRQWQNSQRDSSGHINGGSAHHHNRGGSPSPFATPSRDTSGSGTSLMESEASLHQYWVRSSPVIANSNRKQEQPIQTEPLNDRIPKAPTQPTNTSPEGAGPSSNISHSSSGDALSSRAGSTTRSVLSEEEEEAYMNDYGSFEGLPTPRDVVGDGDPPWETNLDRNSNEEASLLNHDRLENNNTTASYMSVDDETTPKQSSTGRNSGPNG